MPYSSKIVLERLLMSRLAPRQARGMMPMPSEIMTGISMWPRAAAVGEQSREDADRRRQQENPPGWGPGLGLAPGERLLGYVLDDEIDPDHSGVSMLLHRCRKKRTRSR